MHEEAIEKYLEEFPAEIRDAVSELSSPQRWAVFLAVLKQDWNFNGLKRELGISAQQLDTILRGLVIGGLVYREVESPSGIGDRKKTRYTIAPAGIMLARSMLDAFLPETKSRARKAPAGYALQKYDQLLVCEPVTRFSLDKSAGIPGKKGKSCLKPKQKTGRR